MVYGGDGISAVHSFKNRLGKCLLKSADKSGLGFGRVIVVLKCLPAAAYLYYSMDENETFDLPNTDALSL